MDGGGKGIRWMVGIRVWVDGGDKGVGGWLG